jgi:hypothetical protein
MLLHRRSLSWFSRRRHRSRYITAPQVQGWCTPPQRLPTAFGFTWCGHAGSTNAAIGDLYRRCEPVGAFRGRCVRGHPPRGRVADRGRVGRARRSGAEGAFPARTNVGDAQPRRCHNPAAGAADQTTRRYPTADRAAILPASRPSSCRRSDSGCVARRACQNHQPAARGSGAAATISTLIKIAGAAVRSGRGRCGESCQLPSSRRDTPRADGPPRASARRSGIRRRMS